MANPPPYGQIVGIEVKAAETVRAEDFRAFRHLQTRVGGQFRQGLVLYARERALPFGEDLLALPIDALWRA